MRMKTFLSMFGWVGRKKNKWWGLVFSPQNGEKTERRKWGYLIDKNAHVHFFFLCARHVASFFYFYFYFFPFFFFSFFPRRLDVAFFHFFLFLSS